MKVKTALISYRMFFFVANQIQSQRRRENQQASRQYIEHQTYVIFFCATPEVCATHVAEHTNTQTHIQTDSRNRGRERERQRSTDRQIHRFTATGQYAIR